MAALNLVTYAVFIVYYFLMGLPGRWHGPAWEMAWFGAWEPMTEGCYLAPHGSSHASRSESSSFSCFFHLLPCSMSPAPAVLETRSLTTLTPLYGEDVLYSLDGLESALILGRGYIWLLSANHFQLQAPSYLPCRP